MFPELALTSLKMRLMCTSCCSPGTGSMQPLSCGLRVGAPQVAATRSQSGAWTFCSYFFAQIQTSARTFRCPWMTSANTTPRLRISLARSAAKRPRSWQGAVVNLLDWLRDHSSSSRCVGVVAEPTIQNPPTFYPSKSLYPPPSFFITNIPPLHSSKLRFQFTTTFLPIAQKSKFSKSI